MSYHRKICIVLLIGIPGSGKSYFRNFLERFVEGNVRSGLGSVQMCSVCYDDFLCVRKPIQNRAWKNERLNLMEKVENIIIYFKEHNVCYKDFNERFPGVYLINENIQEPNSTLILIDDNMYYRSMRYEYYKLARTHSISFAQIYFYVDLEEALKCNRKRIETRVPDGVIETMLCKIECPQESHLWETNSVTVLSYANFQSGHVLRDIFCCLKQSLENPVKLILPSTDNQEAKHITYCNALHQIDNVLKQMVRFYITNIIIRDGNSGLNLISKGLSEKRLKLLKQIKEGHIDLEVSLNKPISKEKLDKIKPLLSALLLDSEK